MIYAFPFEECRLLNFTRIYIFGAGVVGNQLQRQIDANADVLNLGFIDNFVTTKNAKFSAIRRIGVHKPEILKTVEYDCIVIACHDKRLVLEICETLFKIGVEPKKILIANPDNEQRYEKYLISTQPTLHKIALKKVKEKINNGEKLRVVFFVHVLSHWKTDILFQKMLLSTHYDPMILICTSDGYGEETMFEYTDGCIDFFQKKKYPFVVAYDRKEGIYLDVKNALNPDLIFFSIPYEQKQYNITEFMDVLTCYVPYAFFLIEGHRCFDELLHNLCWLLFYETQSHVEMAKKYQRRKAENIIHVGYPGLDPLLFNSQSQNNVWKNVAGGKLKKIIWAPHWTDIEGFFFAADIFNYLVRKYQDKIQFAFKPHPLLKVKIKECWDDDKIEEYCQTWQNLPNGQYENGDYIDLFLDSDALIHNGGSFSIEYACTGNPLFSLHRESAMLFASQSAGWNVRFTELYEKIMSLHYHITVNEIEKYINDIILNDNDYMKADRLAFINEFIIPPNKKTATDNIYDTISSLIVGSAQNP